MNPTNQETRKVTVDDFIEAIVFECSDSCCSHDFGGPDMFGRRNDSIRKANEENFNELRRRIINEAIDLDALRLVLDVAKWASKAYSDDTGVDAAIAKLEALI